MIISRHLSLLYLSSFQTPTSLCLHVRAFSNVFSVPLHGIHTVLQHVTSTNLDRTHLFEDPLHVILLTLVPNAETV